ncbi:MAG: FKBP-type peptidyl-prolyl cis-trans isomerase [Paraprevotella sp.]|nr:FKBP-type peptidyl-prolyl cis-trans isomerase [Paraprevotella sp.]
MGKKEDYKQKNEEFMARMRQTEGIRTLPMGVLYEVIRSGEGTEKVEPSSVVTIHYIGGLISGKAFDNSRTRQCPAAFRVKDLIPGFQVALCQMKPGDYWRIYIPSEAGYGKRTNGPIPGNSALIFEVELLSIA